MSRARWAVLSVLLCVPLVYVVATTDYPGWMLLGAVIGIVSGYLHGLRARERMIADVYAGIPTYAPGDEVPHRPGYWLYPDGSERPYPPEGK